MRKIRLLFCLLLPAFLLKAQGGLTRYTISAPFNPECISEVSLMLFDQSAQKDKLNQVIIDEMLNHHYLFQKGLVDLKYFYANRKFSADSPLVFDIKAGCTFAANGIYSFAGCPYNACDPKPQSEMEACMAVVDSVSGKALFLKDIIEPSKMDSLRGLIFKLVNMYRIRNVPLCYYETINPIKVKASSSYQVQTNVVTYERDLDQRFFIEDQMIHLYNIASHTAYVYKSVEVVLPVNKLAYFLKDSYRKRMIVE